MIFELSVIGGDQGIRARCHFVGLDIPAATTDEDGHLKIVVAHERPYFGVFIEPLVRGFWATSKIPVTDQDVVECPALPDGPEGWWHAVTNLVPSETAGTGIRIGVVDSPFVLEGLKGRVEQIRLRGGGDPGAGDALAHGAQVCSILTSKADAAEGYSGLCLGATILHTAAVGADNLPRPGVVASAIRSMAQDHGADIINLSWGDAPMPSAAVHKALKDAVASGSLVVVSAGNSGVVQYPAAHEECVAIGALGSRDAAPDGTYARAQSYRCDWFDYDGDQLFHCNFSGVGENISAVAPGCGIIVDVNGRGPFDLTGTSFACPLCVAILAAVLSKDDRYRSMPADSRRVEYARTVFSSLCQDLGLAPEKQGHGLPRLPSL